MDETLKFVCINYNFNVKLTRNKELSNNFRHKKIMFTGNSLNIFFKLFFNKILKLSLCKINIFNIFHGLDSFGFLSHREVFAILSILCESFVESQSAHTTLNILFKTIPCLLRFGGMKKKRLFSGDPTWNGKWRSESADLVCTIVFRTTILSTILDALFISRSASSARMKKKSSREATKIKRRRWFPSRILFRRQSKNKKDYNMNV